LGGRGEKFPSAASRGKTGDQTETKRRKKKRGAPNPKGKPTGFKKEAIGGRKREEAGDPKSPGGRGNEMTLVWGEGTCLQKGE